MADMHRYQVQCICSTAWFIANAVVVVFKSQRYVQEQPQLTKHLPDYFVLSSLNRSHGTLFCSRFRTEGRCSEKHLCKKYNDFRPTSCKIHAELDMPFANFNRLKLKASLSLPPSPYDVSAIFYSCVFLYLLIIQHFQHLKSGVASGFPLCLWCSRCMPPHYQGMLPASVSQLITAESKQIFVLIVQHNILMKHGCVHAVHEFVSA